MNLLLDTHALLWWLDDPHQLSDDARSVIEDERNFVYVGAATAWEIVIKKTLGKLDAPDDLKAALVANRFIELPVTIEHALALNALPSLHRDPFDRILIAQATIEGFTLVTRDSDVLRYPVRNVVA